MAEHDVTDILVNGPHEVWIERRGDLERTEVRFEGAAHLDAFVDRLVGSAGGRLDPSHPIGDVRLGDGSRMHVVLPPLAPRGPLLSIRRFPSCPFSLTDLCERRMLEAEDAEILQSFVVDCKTILVSGRTGTGKTTLLNALIAEVPHAERVVTIEETPELLSTSAHVVSLLVRHESLEKTGRVDQDDLLRAALRMRPDRIVVGEVRGRESLTALHAMATGHEGSMAAIHARSAADASRRLIALALEDPSAPSEAALEAMFASGIDVVVHLHREGGIRRIAEIVQLRT
jgi:pilus assembly protein CpaF